MPCLTGQSSQKRLALDAYAGTILLRVLEVMGERRRARGIALIGDGCAKLPSAYQLDVIARVEGLL